MAQPTGPEPRGADASPRTQPFPRGEAGVPPESAAISAAAATHERERTAEEALRDPVGALRDPENRHKLWLAIAALTLLNTLLLVWLLSTVAGDSGPQPVIVEGQPCLVVEGEDAGTLFCQR